MDLSDDSTSLRIDINNRLSAIEVEALISDLIELRAEMTPAVSAAPPDLDDETASVVTEDAPAIAMKCTKGDRFDLWFRNNGIGWLCFRLPLRDAFAVRVWLEDNLPSLKDDEPFPGVLAPTTGTSQ